MGAGRGAETRHRDTDDVAALNSEPVEGEGGHEQRQGGIQAPGHAYHRLAAAYVVQTRLESAHLGSDDFAAARIQRSLVALRHEGVRLHLAQQPGFEVSVHCGPGIHDGIRRAGEFAII